MALIQVKWIVVIDLNIHMYAYIYHDYMLYIWIYKLYVYYIFFPSEITTGAMISSQREAKKLNQLLKEPQRRRELLSPLPEPLGSRFFFGIRMIQPLKCGIFLCFFLVIHGPYNGDLVDEWTWEQCALFANYHNPILDSGSFIFYRLCIDIVFLVVWYP